MGHCVEAFIAEKSNLDRIQKKYGFSKVIRLPHSLCLLPLTEELYDAVEDRDGFHLSDDRFQFLSPKIGELVLAHSEGRGIAYFETEYFGGGGSQRAVFARKGEVLLIPNHNDNSINQALRLLGVTVTARRDEFDEIYLGWFRSNKDWITQPVYGNEPKFEQIVAGNSG